jgi:hypothetical protein
VLGNVGREEQVGLALVNSDLTVLSGGTLAVGGRTVGDAERSATITGNSDNIMQTGLVDRGVTGVPTADTGDVSIDDSHLDVRVLESNNGGSRTTWKETVSLFRHNCVSEAVYSNGGVDKPAMSILSALRGFSIN